MSLKKIIVWFRKDLRLHDNPAFWEAAEEGIVIPVFIWSDEESEQMASAAGKWWLHYSLIALQKKLASNGLSLVIRQGSVFEELAAICKQTKADAVFYEERFEPSIIRSDRMITEHLLYTETEARSFPPNLLFKSKEIFNQQHQPYKVFTAFWKRTMHETVSRPLPIPESIVSYDQYLPSLTVEELGLLSVNGWEDKFHSYWAPGEAGAIQRWEQFADEDLDRYADGRDMPSAHSVSLLSPYLAWGNISVRAIWYAAKRLKETEEYRHLSVDAFLKQLVWREFSHYQLFHLPAMLHTPLRAQFQMFPWRGSDEAFAKWKKGMTGYPLVDAGMRELWETGAIHNRVRMVVASFLVKHLLISWVDGSDWFKETLVDFDAASNALGWQWIAGTGIDSAPYFRIFNPILQSEKFDPAGVYMRKWIPELEKLPSKYIHEPWKAPSNLLLEHDIVLGETYPFPMIDHALARIRALEAYGQVKNK